MKKQEHHWKKNRAASMVKKPLVTSERCELESGEKAKIPEK